MRFSIPSNVLNSKLNILSKVISSKNSMEILDNFLFEVKDAILTITASDSTNTMQCKIELPECDGEGEFCIQNRKILTSVKELADQPLAFEVDLNMHNLKIIYQNGSYSFNIVDAEAYPRMKSLQGEASTFVLPSKILAENINRTLFATGSDELHMVMNGIYFDLKEDYLAVVATDGHKLVRNRIYSCKTEVPASLILPKKPSNLLRSILTSDDSEVSVTFNASSAEIMFEDGVIVCRLIEGRYPNYNGVIPQDNPNKLTIDRKAFIGALRRVMPFASESTQLIKLRLDYNNVEINAEDIEFSTSAKENIICDYGGMPMSIGFKGSSLYEICNNLESEELIFELADPGRAGTICPAEQPENQDVLMLVMPMLLVD